MGLERAYQGAVPFPAVPRRLVEAYGLGDLSLRRFGTSPDDLEVDFEQASKPKLITDLLANCTCWPDGRSPLRGFLWDLDVGKRIECLLLISGLEEEDHDRLTVPLRCNQDRCDELMEIGLSLSAILDSVHLQDEEALVAEHGGQRALLRRPTARDQLDWLRRSYPSETEAVDEMVSALIVEGPKGAPSRGLVEEIQRTLEDSDPLVQFSVTVKGPNCHCEQIHRLDLAELALARMSLTQARLLEQVHRLAGAYHWSEAEIIAMPPWRRERYLALLERDGER